jgi:Peptidase M66
MSQIEKFNSQNMTKNPLVALVAALAVVGCGGGDSGTGGVTPPSPPPTVAKTALKIGSFEYAQTHILPEGGIAWTLPSETGALTLVGNRDTLALVTLTTTDATNPVIQASANGAVLGTVPLNPPSALPPTEAGGAAYKTGLYSAQMPAAWFVKGLSLTVSADNYLASTASNPLIGAPSKLDVNIVPFYLFGATDANSQLLSAVQSPSAAIQKDIYDKWPVSALTVKPFNGGRVSLPSLVVGVRADKNGVTQPAYRLSNTDQQLDGFAAMSGALNLLGLMRAANGESATSNLYYGPMITLNAAGKQVGTGGGLGGGDSGVGDTSYGGIFIHEMGHAFGLPHANDGYLAGKYPYVGGSDKGSAWGYNQNAKIFLNLIVDKSAANFANCATTHQTDPSGLCYKQDPMQSGAEDKTAGFTYGTFSDFNIGKIQQWFEGKTTLDAAGKHVQSGGVIFPDTGFSSGYARWDGVDKAMVEYLPALSQNGLYGINDNLPTTKNVPVYAIMIAYSQAGTPGASIIYPPVKYTGNLIKTFDPSNTQDLADFTIDTGKYAWYCKGYGCDYSIRVTYADGSIIYRVLKGGFRSWFSPTAALPATATDPLNSGSFKTWAINVPGNQPIAKIEMLDTPLVWKGLPTTPTVLQSY